jgi:hypothetical protein
MKKKVLPLLSGLFLIIIGTSSGQNTEAIHDTSLVAKPVVISILNLHPVNLNKRKVLFSLQADYPEYYKYLNQKNGKTERVSDNIALNEAFYFGHISYGLTDHINLFVTLPVTSIHHYSPSATIIGKGFGDFKIGARHDLFNQNNFVNSLTSGATITFPTGRYKNISSNDYPIGRGAFEFKGDITGLHRFSNLNMIYSVYYEIRTKTSEGLNVGDETGVYLTFQKQIQTKYGNFGIEGGAYGHYNFKDKKDDTFIPYTNDYAVNLYFGAWYTYLKDFTLRFGIPYTLYQNKSWLTKYEVIIQLAYHFDLIKNK